MSRRTKIIIALGVILILMLIGYLLFRSRDGGGGIGGGIFGGGGGLPNTGGGQGPPLSGGSNVPPGGTLPVTDNEVKKLVRLSKDPVVGAVTRGEDRVVYFKLGLGHIYETPFDGAGGESLVSNLTIKDLIGAKWSKSRTYALLTTNTKAAVRHVWFRLTGTSTVETGTFVNDVFGLDFAPDADRIAWMTPINETSLSLRTSNPDETSIKTVATVQIPDFEIYWIKKDLLALKSKTSSEAPSLLQTMSLAGVSNIISSEKKGFDVIWHGDGTEYLSSEDGVKLEVHDEKNSTVKELSLKTLPEKCAFSIKDRNVLFCAVPRSLGQEALPDAWWQGRVNFADSLWKINLGSGESSLLLGGGGFDITHLFTSPHEDYIFFINKNDSTLWSLRII